jgi:uncharacterized protein
VVPGTGTALNVAAVLVGTAVGVAAGARLPERVSTVVTDALGLLTLLVAGLQAAEVVALGRPDALGRTAVLVVLGALLIGGVVGALLRVEERLEGLGARLQRRLGARAATDAAPQDESALAARERFVQGFVLASLVFSVGPLAIIGSLADGLRGDIELLAIKSTLDCFASLAFAAALGWGVGASALVLLGYQGGITALAVLVGDVVPDLAIDALTVVGGLLLVGVSLRLLKVKDVAVGDLLPALLVAPALALLVDLGRG